MRRLYDGVRGGTNAANRHRSGLDELIAGTKLGIPGGVPSKGTLA